jgi:hypothetical protein
LEFIDFGPLIPIAGIFAGVAFAWIGLKNRQLALEHKRLEQSASVEAEEKHRLEQRMRVLEKIITDGGLQTAAQIEALRETPELTTRERVEERP